MVPRQARRLMTTMITIAKIHDPPAPPDAKEKLHHPKPGTKKFTNPWPSFGGIRAPYYFAAAKLKGDISPKSIPETIQADVGWQRPDWTHLDSSEHASQLKVVWLGHASFFLQMPTPEGAKRGLRILFDPILSQRCSPSQYFGGPKRYTPPPVATVDQFPEIDIVCISHNHYDHLDYATVQALESRFGKDKLQWFVSLGNRQWFLQNVTKQSDRVSEMDWWEKLEFSKVIDGATVSCTIGYLPAQHGSGRSLSDQGHSLWGSYSIESPEGKKVWFAGDTARRTVTDESTHKLDDLPVCPAHAQIGQFRGPFDFAMIPIGAYKPRYLMSPVHIDPFEAVDIFKEVRAEKAVGMHWGTFALSAEECLAPRELLSQACRDQGIKEFECWNMGELKFIRV